MMNPNLGGSITNDEWISEEEIEDPKELPHVPGFHLLIRPVSAKKKSKGGIIKASSTIQDEEVSNICGYVLKLGTECYKDTKRFPTGAWCKEGDWVIFRAYSGTRMKMYGQEFRLINDDTVEAVVDDPTGVVRA